MKSAILLVFKSPPIPPTNAPLLSNSETEMEVGIRLSGVTALFWALIRPFSFSSPASPGLTSSSLIIPAALRRCDVPPITLVSCSSI